MSELTKLTLKGNHQHASKYRCIPWFIRNREQIIDPKKVAEELMIHVDYFKYFLKQMRKLNLCDWKLVKRKIHFIGKRYEKSNSKEITC